MNNRNNREHDHEVFNKSIQAKDFVDERPCDGYDELLFDIRNSFYKSVGDCKEPLFTTDAGSSPLFDLYGIFLSNIPHEAQQHYKCRACRNFVNRYGGIVKIASDGTLQPIMWDSAPIFFSKAVEAVYRRVRNSKITGVFITDEKILGTPKTGVWNHMAVYVPKAMIHKNRLLTPNQAMSEKYEDFKMVMSAINKYQLNTVETAVNLLRSDSMYRGEKVLGIAEWFLELKQMRPMNTNLVWKKVAIAPAGFCHISSSMIGTLLDDIEDGLDFETVIRRFNEKMDPLHYQRPQVAPSAGNVARAEKIVAELGLANSLERRFARLDEIETIWKPASVSTEVKSGGVFAGIKTKETAEKMRYDVIPPATTMTWEKFQRTVLPMAKKIDLYIPDLYIPYDRGSYAALVTAEDHDATPIIKWDSEEHRNPFSWYMYSGGSDPNTWNLPAGKYVEVTAIALQPNMWQPGFEHIGKGAFFILKDCKDANNKSLSLFPELLRSELHEVRATIEAYSKDHRLSGYDRASACGLCIQSSGRNWDYKLRVTTDVGVNTYKLDRWD